MSKRDLYMPGIKLCVGHPGELASLVHAMLKTGIKPDFVTVDGAEGGTGAAPPEFSNSVHTQYVYMYVIYYIYIHLHACIHVYTHTHAYMYTHTHTQTHTHTGGDASGGGSCLDASASSWYVYVVSKEAHCQQKRDLVFQTPE